MKETQNDTIKETKQTFKNLTKIHKTFLLAWRTSCTEAQFSTFTITTLFSKILLQNWKFEKNEK